MEKKVTSLHHRQTNALTRYNSYLLNDVYVYVYVYVIMTTFEIFLFMFINGYIMQWWSEIRLLIFYDVSSYYGSADTIDNNEK